MVDSPLPVNRAVLDLAERKDAAARRHGRCLINAANDKQAIALYLEQKAKNPRTLEAYKREITRFWLWCMDRSLADLDDIAAEDVVLYQRALTRSEVETPKQREARQLQMELNAAGAQTLSKPKPSSVNYAIGILRALFEYLFKVRYLTANVFVAVSPLRVETGNEQVQRYLTKSDLNELLETIEGLRRDTVRHLAIYHQTRWLVCVAVMAGLRRAEAADGRMDAFRQSEDGRWWLDVTGKGNKRRSVPVPSPLLEELRTYRASLRELLKLPKLPDLPGTQGEIDGLPMVCRVTGEIDGVAARRVGKIVDNVVVRTAMRMRENGDERRASLFERISTHWLRHTGVTKVASGSDVRTAQKFAGHSDVRTTMLYFHDEESAMHDKVSEAFDNSPMFEGRPSTDDSVDPMKNK